MAKLPILSGKALIAALKKNGFEVIRQKGSHVSLRKDAKRTVVPLHHELAHGTLLGILKQCEMTKDDLLDLLGKT